MPTRAENLAAPEVQQIITNLRIGIAKIESSSFKNPYQAQPGWKKDKNGKIIEPRKRISTASGKYQFLAEWLNDKKNALGDSVKGIESFAKESGIYRIEGNTTEEKMASFRNQPELQEAYFGYYAKNVLIPEAGQIMGKNPLNLSFDSIAASVHFQGYPKAQKQIQSGQLAKKTDTNVNGYKYIDVYNSALKENGFKPVTTVDIIKSKEKRALETGTNPDFTPAEKEVKQTAEQIIENYKTRNKAIDDLDPDYTSQAAKEKLRQQLWQEEKDKGNLNIINEYIENENKNNVEKVDEYNHLLDVVQKINVKYTNENGKKKFKDNAIYIDWKDSDVKEREYLRKKYPEMFLDPDGDPAKSDYKNFVKLPELLKTFSNKHKELTGEEIKITEDDIKKTGVEKAIDFVPALVNKATDITVNPIQSAWQKLWGKNRTGKIELKDLQKISSDIAQQTKIDESKLKEKTLEEKYAPEDDETVKKTETTETDEAGQTEITNKGLASEFLDRELKLNSTNGQQFNYEPGKKELPIDAIVGMSLGLIGNEQAKNAKIPLREEEVSQAFKNYTAELANRSKEGLPVEIEAMMKNQLADAYQGGLENIVNASAGNRATVLGNLGQLEQAKNKGLIAIQVADFEAKDRAFAQYGKALQYMSDFDARKDIANHQIRYTEGKEKQQLGRQLATAGFAKLTDALKYAKENGPGSANDQYRSMLMQNIFGFDPKMPDDGSGNVPGTKSAYEKARGLTMEKHGKALGLREKISTLNADQKAKMDDFVAQNQNIEDMDKFADYLKTNPNADLSKLSMENIDLALKNNDFNLLSMGRRQATKGGLEAPLQNELPVASSTLPKAGTLIGNINLNSVPTAPKINPVQMPKPNLPKGLASPVQMPIPNFEDPYGTPVQMPNAEELGITTLLGNNL